MRRIMKDPPDEDGLPGRLCQELDDIRSQIESAMYDMAEPLCVPERFVAAARRGVPQHAQREAVADDLYNDTDTIADLVGDRIHDAFSSARVPMPFGKQRTPEHEAMWDRALKRVCGMFNHLPGLYDKLKH